MKTTDYHFLSLLIPVTLGAQAVVPLEKDWGNSEVKSKVMEIRPQTTAATFAERKAKTSNPYQNSELNSVKEKVIVNVKEASFLKNSEFLVGAKGFVILPKGSTVTSNRSLNVVSEAPEHLKLQGLKEFQWSNPSAIRQLPITEAMMNGDAKALEALTRKVEVLKTGGIAYVTTLNGNPVSLPGLSVL